FSALPLPVPCIQSGVIAAALQNRPNNPQSVTAVWFSALDNGRSLGLRKNRQNDPARGTLYWLSDVIRAGEPEDEVPRGLEAEGPRFAEAHLELPQWEPGCYLDPLAFVPGVGMGHTLPFDGKPNTLTVSEPDAVVVRDVVARVEVEVARIVWED